MQSTLIDLDELLTLIRSSWTAAYARGRILHLHRNAIRLSSGSLVHLRVLVQEVSEAEKTHAIDNAKSEGLEDA